MGDAFLVIGNCFLHFITYLYNSHKELLLLAWIDYEITKTALKHILSTF